MKKFILYIFIAVLILQVVCAGEIFNGEVKDNVPFEVNDVNNIARYYAAAKKVSILVGEDRILVPVGDCAPLNDLKYCIDEAVEGFADETGSPASTMKLRVLQAGPTIEIDRSISDDEPNLDEEIEMTVTLSNTGNEKANDVNYADNYPNAVKLTSSFNNPIGNGILWAGDIDAGKSQLFRYKLKFQDFINHTSIAEVKFVFNNKVNKINSDDIKFDVKKPYKIIEAISSENADLDEELQYNITINNTRSDKSILVDKLEIVFPAGALITGRDMKLKQEEGKMTYTGTIKESSSVVLYFRFKSLKVIKGQVAATVNILSDAKKFEQKFTHNVGIGVPDISPEITITPETVKGGAEIEIEAKITNVGKSKISYIDIEMSSDLVEPKSGRGLELEPGKKYYTFNKIINAPSSDEEKTYFIRLNGNYNSPSKKIVKFDLIKNVTVTPQEMIIQVVPNIVFIGKDKVNVTLNVKNIAAYKLSYVSLIDALPSGFKMTAGSRDADIDELGIGEEKTAYSYLMTIPASYKKDSFNLTHTVNAIKADEEKVMFEKKTTVKIETEEETTASASQENKTAEGSNNATSEETTAQSGEPGFFGKIWGWFKGLFSGKEESQDKME